ncbi:hypothetical protein [Streptomyces qinzhouensis]|uniref:Uncharacterized protein n=1 Tax=Streptomyces qinzhouensis TaxID=2599401 RepID=A0A5B8J4V5_9ACTN|nr:hypothetical protein [Streptomyces qinzhouensis]QDY76815.1 hypothetical protein FQU76_10045 [Streptomyces qinzhouensis]
MKRPLRTALADALHLRERKGTRDPRPYRYQQPGTGRGTGTRPTRCGMEPCGLDPLRTAPEEGPAGSGGPGYGRADRRPVDYRTPTGGDPYPGSGTGTGTGSADSDRPGEDTLFLFLKSLHQFLTAPQDAAAERTAPPERPPGRPGRHP